MTFLFRSDLKEHLSVLELGEPVDLSAGFLDFCANWNSQKTKNKVQGDFSLPPLWRSNM